LGVAPDLRILQANERTFLAWARTGIALVIFGFALARVAVWLEPMDGTRKGGAPSDDALVVIGVVLVLAGSLVPGLAALRHRRIRAAIINDQPIIPSVTPTIALAVLLGCVGLGLVFWLGLA
jgi:putative membrane protein